MCIYFGVGVAQEADDYYADWLKNCINRIEVFVAGGFKTTTIKWMDAAEGFKEKSMDNPLLYENYRQNATLGTMRLTVKHMFHR